MSDTTVTDMTQAIRLDLEPDEAGEFLIAYASYAGAGEHDERYVIGKIALGPAGHEPVFAKFVVAMQAVIEQYLRARYGGDGVVWCGNRQHLTQ
jgi:hypothetical protein